MIPSLTALQLLFSAASTVDELTWRTRDEDGQRRTSFQIRWAEPD